MRFATVLLLTLLLASIFAADGWFLGRRRRRRTRACPAAPSRLRHHRFNYDTAVKMWTYSLIAYQKRTWQIRSWTCRRCRWTTRLYDVQVHSGRRATRAFTGYDPSYRSFVVSFRGSAGVTNWFNNLKIAKKSPPFFSGCGGRVHRGFLSSYNALRRKVIDALRALKRKYKNRVGKLYVTGHSLGGAMATIAAPDLRNVLRLDTRAYTFSSPRVGDSSFVNYYKRRIATSWRCYNKGDVVVSLVPRWWPFKYRHVGTGIAINRRYCGGKRKHHGHSKYFGLTKRR